MRHLRKEGRFCNTIPFATEHVVIIDELLIDVGRRKRFCDGSCMILETGKSYLRGIC